MVDIVTLAQARAHLNDDTADATELGRFITAASVVIGERCPAAVLGPAPANVTWDKPVTYGMGAVLLPQPVKTLVSVTVYSSRTPTVYAANDITAAAPAYGYTYEPGAGLLTLSPMPYGSTVRVVYTPGLAADKQATAELAALELVRFWWQPSQYGAMTEDGPLDRSGGAGTGTITVAGYLVPNAVASLLDAISEPRVGFA